MHSLSSEAAHLIRFAQTDRQREYMEALHQEGSERKAALACGVSKSTIHNTVQMLRVEAGKSDTNVVLQQEIKDLREQNRQLLMESADAVAYKQFIHEATKIRMSPPEWLEMTPLKKGGFFHGTPTLMLSDIHWAERVIAAQINNSNIYNLEVAKARLKYTFQKTIQMLFEGVKDPIYNGFVLVFGGDMLSGNIHEELRETNDLPLLVAVIDLLEELIAGIDLLLTRFSRIFIPCVVGNHGRLDHRPRMKNGAHDNVDWLLYHLLMRHYAKDKRVSFLIPDGFEASYRLHGRVYLLTHGDSFRGGNAISGPITAWILGCIRKTKRYAAVGINVDTILFGHWHQQLFGQNNLFISNGSVIGYNEFAHKFSFPFEPPRQALWVTAPNGDIPLKLDVYCEEPPEITDKSWVSI